MTDRFFRLLAWQLLLLLACAQAPAHAAGDAVEIRHAHLEAADEGYKLAASYAFELNNGLEDAIQQIGEQLHSQYLISYSPSNKEEGGWHQIAVTVGGTDYKTQTRPGYWLATKQ